MLVISRKVGEALRIGRDITVAVQDIQGKQVKLTISAPASVAVARAELERTQAGETGETTADRGRSRGLGVPDGGQS